MIQTMKSHYGIRIKDGENNAGRRLEAYFSKKCAADSSLGGQLGAARMITLKNGTTILYKRELGSGHGPLCEDHIGMYVSATPDYMKRAIRAFLRCVPKEDVFVEQLSQPPDAMAGKTATDGKMVVGQTAAAGGRALSEHPDAFCGRAGLRENIGYDDGFTSGMEYLDSIMVLPTGR